MFWDSVHYSCCSHKLCSNMGAGCISCSNMLLGLAMLLSVGSIHYAAKCLPTCLITDAVACEHSTTKRNECHAVL